MRFGKRCAVYSIDTCVEGVLGGDPAKGAASDESLAMADGFVALLHLLARVPKLPEVQATEMQPGNYVLLEGDANIGVPHGSKMFMLDEVATFATNLQLVAAGLDPMWPWSYFMTVPEYNLWAEMSNGAIEESVRILNEKEVK